jgi:hypothetical protein
MAWHDNADKNGDGKVTPDEFDEHILVLFKKCDQDSNGEMTIEEFTGRNEIFRCPRNPIGPGLGAA